MARTIRDCRVAKYFQPWCTHRRSHQRYGARIHTLEETQTILTRSDINLAIEVVEQAQREAGQFIVEDLRDIRADADGNVELLVHWAGYPSTYDSWADAVDIYDDIGTKVTQFVKNMKDNEAMNALKKP